MQEIKLVKNLAFGDTARSQILAGVEKLTNAVSSTLGASGKCVIIEDSNGEPQITKDGVTVANSIILLDPLENIGAISSNNDKFLGKLIGKAFKMVDDTGVVTMELSDDSVTKIEMIEGVQIEQGIVSHNFITDKDKGSAELDNPLVLIIESYVDNIRKIQQVLEHVIKNNESLLIIADVDVQVMNALAMNKIKGNIKINIINAPIYGLHKKDTLIDLCALTGATLINEDLGDDMDIIQPEHLGRCLKSISGREDTRLSRLKAKVATVKVGGNSRVELVEKKDRVEDAICATKAAIKEGIVPGGGVALLNASYDLKPTCIGEEVLYKAIRRPYELILKNAGIQKVEKLEKGKGLNVVTGETVDMVKAGIIDPLLVTKSALINAASVATTILSTDCVINNIRHESDR